MKLSYKTRALLELLITTGLDAVEFTMFPNKHLMQIGSWSEDRLFRRHLKNMRENGWIVWDDSKGTGEWVLKITETGRKVIMEDINPEERWARSWNKRWRFIAFDLPASKQSLRKELLQWLKVHRFGRLQDSLWINPFFDKTWDRELACSKFDPSGVSFIEGASFARSSDRDFVAKSWKFDEINRRYVRLIEFHQNSDNYNFENEFGNWIHQENALWREAFELDPFLPNELLPKKYQGKNALAIRRESYARFKLQ